MEFAELLKLSTNIYNSGYQAGHEDTVESCFVLVHPSESGLYHADIVREILVSEGSVPCDDPRPSLYNMKEGDILHLGSVEPWEVLCVPGGWIYTRFCENGTGGYDMSSCFVPFINQPATPSE